MGEALGEVLALFATEGETAKQWTTRVRETFHKCKRRANTDFPSTAHGWTTLNCAGLWDAQKAVIKAKTQGSLDFDDDVQSFLAEHTDLPQYDEAELSESEAAEGLAVSWKEKVTEIARLNEARKFTKSTSSGVSTAPSRREFRVEIDQLERRTRCRQCSCLGHWAPECKNLPSGSDTKIGASSFAPAAGAGYVEAEGVEPDITFIGAADVVEMQDILFAGLLSLPGCGVVDS
eukprot:s3945_g10.t1